MTWLLAETWFYALVAFLLGALCTWLFLVRSKAREVAELGERLAGTASLGPRAAGTADPAETAQTAGQLSAARAQVDALSARLAQQDEEHRTKVGDLEADLNGARARLADLEIRLTRQEERASKKTAELEAALAEARGTAPDVNGGTPAASGDAAAAAQGFTVKGSTDSMRYHSPASPYYERTVAEVWFRSVEEAEAAGFKAWNVGRE
jgi:TolA-binding protein